MIRMGIVVSNGEEDKTQSGMCRVFIPGYHSNEFKKEDLTLCSLAGTGDQEGTTRFSAPPEPGSWVQIELEPGYNKTLGNGVITRVIKDVKNNKQSLPGNLSIRGFKVVADAFAEKLPINSKAKAGKGPSGTKPTQEAGGKFYRDLTKAIPASSTLWPLAGMKIPQVKGVPTAKTPFANILSGDALGGLPGAALSLGSLFKNMPSSAKQKIDSALPAETRDTLNSVINLLPEDEPEGLHGARVNTEVFYAHAANLISQCRDTEDLMICITELVSNTAYHGTESLANVTIQVETPFGNSNVVFTTSGSSTDKHDDTVKDAISKFSSLLSSGASFPGTIPGKNMWGGSSKIMGEMMSRLKPGEYKTAIQQAQKSIASGSQPRQLINDVRKLIHAGANWMKG